MMPVHLKNFETALTELFHRKGILASQMHACFSVESQDKSFRITAEEIHTVGCVISKEIREIDKNAILWIQSFLKNLKIDNTDRVALLKSLHRDHDFLESTHDPYVRDIASLIRRTLKEEKLMPILTDHVYKSRAFEIIRNHPLIVERVFDNSGELLHIFGVSERLIKDRILQYDDIQKIINDCFQGYANKDKIHLEKKDPLRVLDTLKKTIRSYQQSGSKDPQAHAFIVAPQNQFGHTISFVLLLENEKIKMMSVDSVSSTEAIHFTHMLFRDLRACFDNNIAVGHRRLITQRENTLCGIYAIVDAVNHTRETKKSLQKFQQLEDFERGRKYLGDKILRILDKISNLQKLTNTSSMLDRKMKLESKLRDYMVYFSAMRLSRETAGTSVSDDKIQRLYQMARRNIHEYIQGEMFMPQFGQTVSPLDQQKLLTCIRGHFNTFLEYLPNEIGQMSEDKKRTVNEILNGTIDIKKFTKDKHLPNLNEKEIKTKAVVNHNMEELMAYLLPQAKKSFEDFVAKAALKDKKALKTNFSKKFTGLFKKSKQKIKNDRSH